MHEKQYYFYLLASKKYGTLYAGVTSDLIQRVYQHKTNIISGFTKQYHVHTLVYYEEYGDVMDAIAREKEIKKWCRDWKINLIERENPHWMDLYPDLL